MGFPIFFSLCGFDGMARTPAQIRIRTHMHFRSCPKHGLLLLSSAFPITGDTIMTRNRTAVRLFIATLILSAVPGLTLAATNTISAVVPWQGQGQIFPIGVGKFRLLGAIEGIMYVETAEGAMNEALVRCPIVQELDAAKGSASVSGNCTIIASNEDAAFAELSCEGISGLCTGTFKLTGGTGRFAGISGSGKMVVRSPVQALAADLSDGSVFKMAAGILQLPALKIKLP